MATRLKPSRINVDNTPRVWDGAAYQNDNDFHWSMGGWDMSYEDFEWHTLTGTSLVIEDISNNITPSSDFTVSAGTVKPGIEYVLRVNTGNTPYTMTLGTGVTNPNGYSTELTPNKVNQFKFIATSDSQLELEGVDTSEYITWLTILSYGNSTWNDFITAYNKNSIVYCRASSNSNPATWAQNRLAFMAYVNNATSPTEVEFQYYRSRSSHGSDANQQDEVYVYKLTNASWWTWTVEVRDTAAKIATWTWLTKAYTTSWSKSTLTIANDGVLTVNGSNGTVTVNDIKQSATAPANPTAWTAWYDTTNGVLKVYNGTAWDNIATWGAISDTAYGSGWDGQTTTAPSQNAVYDKINSIDALIPSEATSSNKLADKAFVGDSINSVTAYYITKNANWDQFATYAELAAATTFYSGGVVRVPTMNDYTIVLDDENHDHATTRYIYNNGWEYQYTVNETALTQAQLNALNSGITAGKVATYDWYATSKQDKLVNQSNIKSINNNSLLGSWNITLNDVKVSATAPSSPTEWMVWYDTTNDQLKVYDWTNWNVTGKEYNAGEWIGVWTYNDYSAMQWPAPDGFHIPMQNEWVWLKSIMNWMSLTSSDNRETYLHMPLAWTRSSSHAVIENQGSYAYYWSCSPNSNNSYYLAFDYVGVYIDTYTNRAEAYPIRSFKDCYETPDSSWIVVQWTLGGAWIFWNQTEWLISITNGTNWYTIMDKNLWATIVYNYWDTLSEANCGKYYQWGNNYWFAWAWTIADQSTTQVDASGYWPWNYYNSSTFIILSDDWSSVPNANLRWWVTWVVTIDNAITNTGVLSVNGQTGNVTIPVWILVDSASPIQLTKIWAGTQAQYEALGSYDATTVYLTI